MHLLIDKTVNKAGVVAGPGNKIKKESKRLNQDMFACENTQGKDKIVHNQEKLEL